MQREELIRQILSVKPSLTAEGVEHMALFGSRARGDNRDDSDVDLLVEVPSDARFSLLNLVGVQLIVTDRTGIQAQAMMRRSLPPDFRDAIRDDIIELF